MERTNSTKCSRVSFDICSRIFALYDYSFRFAYGYFDGVQPINYIIEDDLKLRFFDICPKYESTIKTNESASREYSEYLSTTRMLRNVYSVRKQLGLSEATQLTAKDVVTMFSGCAYVPLQCSPKPRIITDIGLM